LYFSIFQIKKSMKKLLVILPLLFFVFAANSQGLRLNAYGNYVFDDQVDNSYSYTTPGYFSGKVKGGFMWGGGLEYRFHDYYGLELMYLRLDTHAPVDYWDYGLNNVKSGTWDVSMNYIMVGGARSMKPGAKVDPYGGLMLGMAIIDTKAPDGVSNSATRFAWGARLGTNIWTAGRVGLKLQAQILSVPQGAGGGLYFGTGGAGVGVSTYSTVLQFALGGGLTFKLGQQHAASAPAQH
jgi:hypothetical protein